MLGNYICTEHNLAELCTFHSMVFLCFMFACHGDPNMWTKLLRDIKDSSVQQTIERTSVPLWVDLQSDYLHNNTVFCEQESPYDSSGKDRPNTSGKCQLTNLLKLELAVLHQRNFCIFHSQILHVTFWNGWKQLHSTNGWLEVKWTSSNGSS